MNKDYEGIPDFDDDPTIDTVNQCYLRSRTDPDENKMVVLEDMFDEEHRDYITPCGVKNDIFWRFQSYEKTRDIGVLISMLEDHAICGKPAINEALIDLLKKTRTKPISKRDKERQFLHKKIFIRYYLENPQKGEVEAVYVELANEFEKTVASIKTIITRARNKGWFEDRPLIGALMSIDASGPNYVSKSDKM